LCLLSWVPAHAGSAVGVVVAPVTMVGFPKTVEALGTARANESVEIRPKITETVSEIRFVESQHVEKGAVLVELDDRSAQAAVASARAAFADSRNKYERAQELFRESLIPASELESIAARRDGDRALLDAAQARLSDTVIRAPFAGRVGLRRVSVGSLVTPSTVIVTLDDTDTIKLDFDVPETALSLVEPERAVLARSAAWPDETFRGQVQSVDTRVDPVSRMITVRALVPNPAQMLRPGMFLTVELRHDDASALVLPEQALIPEQSRQFVLVVDADGRAEKREVQIGRRRPGQVEILDGVEQGELVVVEGTQKARPGEPVEIVGRVEVGA
jgi:membrane fusion protein (multidrug efflux system)